MEIVQIPIDKLIAYEKNNRKHPQKQLNALKSSIMEYGFIQPMVVDDKNVIVIGHGRLEAYKQLVEEKLQLEKTLPCVKLNDLTKAQIKKLRIMDNKINDMGERDIDNLKFELEELGDTGVDDLFKDILEEVVPKEKKEREYKEEPETDEDGNIYQYNEGIIFKSENIYDIPTLLPNMLYDGELPSYTANGSSDVGDELCLCLHLNVSVKSVTDKIVGFYLDDYKFETVRENAVAYLEKVKDSKPRALMTPNFSIWSDEPIPYQLFARYKTMRCGRFRQEAGFKIIPTLNRGSERTHDFVFLGLPKDIPVASIQVRNLRTPQEKRYFKLGIAKLKDFNIGSLIIYGINNKEFVQKTIDELGLTFKLHYLGTRQDRIVRKPKG